MVANKTRSAGRAVLISLVLLAVMLPLQVLGHLEPRQKHRAASSSSSPGPSLQQTPVYTCNGMTAIERKCGNDFKTNSDAKPCTGLVVQFYSDDGCKTPTGRPYRLRNMVPTTISQSIGSFKVLDGESTSVPVFFSGLDATCAVGNGLAIDPAAVRQARSRPGGGCIVSPFTPSSVKAVTSLVGSSIQQTPAWETSRYPTRRTVAGAPRTVGVMNNDGATVELYNGPRCTGAMTRLNVLYGGSINICTPVSPAFGRFQSAKVVEISTDSGKAVGNTLSLSVNPLDSAPDSLSHTFGCGRESYVTGLSNSRDVPRIGSCFDRSALTTVTGNGVKGPQNVVSALFLQTQDPPLAPPS
ncbi:uncharacterized protein PFL1_03046 [Pseudozyma flocculosa PF-1]|uniref:Uncharacterized protein n=2 Tax=Pseudozyma flocculosa TaxID=84751 RepID=A0A5C3EZV6_9BASI|nr:uncharacterized protein PFL1_03046 [Pseudozyma flocculosa PF-1]EPQ29291.1 hypothetical protein PFL1_03046 [Pseudozyma flocculosa PF-1]SPO37803.1 uncharacterized protein PSFLO_03279 [Pseudozyma flocculosa]